ncbi:DUF397 domain-containing protein [Streptomyces microflavus]|uniref:DUF397 domain-containing protein n=1 Tax=Streptomyces microflavus TaxID=1919 RepID=UPI00378B24E5
MWRSSPFRSCPGTLLGTPSNGDGGACVEVAAHPSAVHIRDSKVTDGPVLTVGPAAWNAFIQGGSTAL